MPGFFWEQEGQRATAAREGATSSDSTWSSSCTVMQHIGNAITAKGGRKNLDGVSGFLENSVAFLNELGDLPEPRIAYHPAALMHKMNRVAWRT